MVNGCRFEVIHSLFCLPGCEHLTGQREQDTGSASPEVRRQGLVRGEQHQAVRSARVQVPVVGLLPSAHRLRSLLTALPGA